MKMKAVLAAVLVLAMAIALAVPMESDDGAISVQPESYKITLDANNGGIVAINYVSDVSKPVTITVTDAATGEVMFENIYTFNSTGGQKETVYVPIGPNSGTKTLNFTFSDPEIKGFNITVKFDAGFWSNWTVYAVIIVIAILIAALVLFKSRTPKAKNTLTFEQVEAMKQAEREVASQPKAEKRSSGGSTERQKYLASKKKKE